jgi:integrase
MKSESSSGESVPGFPGIKKKKNGKFLATKSIKGERHYKEFPTLREAAQWKQNFHPLLNKEGEDKKKKPTPTSPNHILETIKKNNKASGNDLNDDLYFNGRNKNLTVEDVANLYCKGRIKLLGRRAQYQMKNRLDAFLPPLYSVRLCELTSEVITEHLEQEKLKLELKGGSSRRCSFNEELKHLRAVLNWYREEKDSTFSVPITKYHKKISEIRKPKKKEKVLPPEKVFQFLENLSEPFYSLALVQYVYALRIGEAAAIAVENVDFVDKKIRISEAIEYLGGQEPLLRDSTKTGVNAELVLVPDVEERLRALNLGRPKGCRYFFHNRGKILSYDMISKQYEIALRKAGIKGITGTHFLRFSMATLTRKMKGLDASQAILRHKSITMSQHYAGVDPAKANEVVVDFQAYFKRLRATEIEEMRPSSEKDNDINNVAN